MNSHEIEQNVRRIIENFSEENFLYDLLLAYDVKFVEAFTLPEIKDFLHFFSDPEFVTDFNYTKPDSRLRGLAKFFKSKTKDVHMNRVLDLIEAFPKSSLQNLGSEKRYKYAVKFIC